MDKETILKIIRHSNKLRLTCMQNKGVDENGGKDKGNYSVIVVFNIMERGWST
jgi:hypothetical protein